MSQGRVEAIHITDTAEAPMRGVAEIRAIAGVGLEGDRYAVKRGSFSAKDKLWQALASALLMLTLLSSVWVSESSFISFWFFIPTTFRLFRQR